MDQTDAPSWTELQSIIHLTHATKKPTVESVTSLSADTVKREHPDKVRQISERRLGMTLGDALAIAKGLK
jgi:hypothetical protein